MGLFYFWLCEPQSELSCPLNFPTSCNCFLCNYATECDCQNVSHVQHIRMIVLGGQIGCAWSNNGNVKKNTAEHHGKCDDNEIGATRDTAAPWPQRSASIANTALGKGNLGFYRPVIITPEFSLSAVQ